MKHFNPYYASGEKFRIDGMYFGGDGVKVLDAAVIGESAATSEIVFDGPWPSGHRAVVATFVIREK